MASATTMTYGSYNFVPVPLLQIGKTYTKSGDGTSIGAVNRVAITGTLTPLPETYGIVDIDFLQDTLKEAFNEDGKLFEVKCGDNVLLQCYPRILDISFSPSSNNWVITCPFSINIEYDHDADIEDLPYLQNAEESWEIQAIPDKFKYTLDLDDGPDSNMTAWSITHTVNATGKRNYISSGVIEMEAWEQARNWVIGRLGVDDEEIISQSGVLNLDMDEYLSGFNHTRVVSLSELNGTYSVIESALYITPSGSGLNGTALEDITINIDTDLAGMTRTRISGQIEGLQEVDFGTNPGDFTITKEKYSSALDYWLVVKPRLYYRAKEVVGILDRDLNVIPSNSSVGHSPTHGIISYDYSYDNRPCNYISGAITETININDTNPVDTFARIVIPGRALGPLLQDISTPTEFKRSISVQAVMAPISGCSNFLTAYSNKPTAQVNEFLCEIEMDLESNYGQVFKSQDGEGFDPKTGVYNRTVEWTCVNCSGDAPNTSMCE